MRYRRQHTLENETEINITPMMDIVFIMLIFFIVTTSFSRDSGVSVERPVAATAEETPQTNNILIAIRESGEIWIDRRSVDLRAVRANVERLRVQMPEGGVVLQADRRVSTGLLIEVMDQVRLAGVRNISVAAEREGA